MGLDQGQQHKGGGEGQGKATMMGQVRCRREGDDSWRGRWWEQDQGRAMMEKGKGITFSTWQPTMAET